MKEQLEFFKENSCLVVPDALSASRKIPKPTSPAIETWYNLAARKNKQTSPIWDKL